MKTARKREAKELADKFGQGVTKKIEYISPRWLKASIRIIPWVILAYVLLMYILSRNIPPEMENRLDELQLTGFIVYAAILFLAQLILNNASGLVVELWERNIFPQDTETELMQFSTRLEYLANHIGWQIIFLSVALFVPLAGILRSCMSRNATGLDMVFCNYYNGAIRTSKSIFEVIIGLFMILVVWRVFILAWGLENSVPNLT